jgi:hypothetical protein
VPVLASPRVSEGGPMVEGGWIAWSQDAVPDPYPPRSRTSVYVRRVGSRRAARVNPPGTYAETGGLDRGRLVLQLVRGADSRLWSYDLRTRRLSVLPRWLNDGRWLWRPTASRGRVLYGAIDSLGTYSIQLADLRRRGVRLLGSTGGRAAYAAPGQVNGDWAVWMSCPDNVCNVWRQNLSRGIAVAAPDRGEIRHSQFGIGVAADGTAYFGRGASRCGDVRILRWTPAGRISTVLRLPPSTAFSYAYVSGRYLYFDATGCAREARSDIYRFRVSR